MRRPLLLIAVSLCVNAAAPGDESTGKTIVKPDAFGTLVNPNCSHCIDESKRRAAELRADDPLLCWIRGYSDGGAIPYRFFLNPYRVISDSYGVFVYDPDAGYARGYPASYLYKFHGWRNGVMLMKHADGTVYSCLSGMGIEGPKKGERLKAIPTVVSQWGFWLDRYPNAVAYHMFDKYAPTELPTKDNGDSIQTRGPVDKRLDGQTQVLGVYGACPRAYPISVLEKEGFIQDNLCDQTLVIFWQPKTRTAAAYRPDAVAPRKFTAPRPDKNGVSPPDPALDTPTKKLTIVHEGKKPDAPYRDKETGSSWDVAGRAVEGELKGWTLTWVDSVQVKWFAWSAEYPETSIHGEREKKDEPKTADPKSNVAPDKAIKEISGTAEFLRAVPKHFGILKDFNPERHEVTLLLDGETLPKIWKLTPDAEIKVMGWWGRLGKIPVGHRVWVWFQTDRKKQANAIFMLADEISEQDIHGDGVAFVSATNDSIAFKNSKGIPVSLKLQQTEIQRGSGKGTIDSFQPGEKIFVQSDGAKALLVLDAAAFELRRKEQKALLRKAWMAEGIPGQMGLVHQLSGEADLIIDHEAQRWARFLKPGDKVELAAVPPIPAVVKSVAPWRERTQLRLVINGFNIVELTSGQRLKTKMTSPPTDWDDSLFPPDLDQKRTRLERIDWFLASVYCTCGIANDTCTGHFFTLSSCNPNGCGAPNAMRSYLGSMIDQGATDRRILEALHDKHGPKLLKPHLLP